MTVILFQSEGHWVRLSSPLRWQSAVRQRDIEPHTLVILEVDGIPHPPAPANSIEALIAIFAELGISSQVPAPADGRIATTAQQSASAPPENASDPLSRAHTAAPVNDAGARLLGTEVDRVASYLFTTAHQAVEFMARNLSQAAQSAERAVGEIVTKPAQPPAHLPSQNVPAPALRAHEAAPEIAAKPRLSRSQEPSGPAHLPAPVNPSGESMERYGVVERSGRFSVAGYSFTTAVQALHFAMRRSRK